MRKLPKIPLFLYDLFISTLIVLSIAGITLGITYIVLEYRPVQLGGGKYYFIVTSGSMEPLFDAGDFVVCSKTTFEDVQVGDVIAVKYPYKEGVIIIHRVVERGEDFLQTKGDVNPAPDNFITVPENVLAKFTNLRIPKLGYLIVFSRTPLGLILCYYLPCFAVIVIQVKKFRKRDEVGKEKTSGEEELRCICCQNPVGEAHEKSCQLNTKQGVPSLVQYYNTIIPIPFIPLKKRSW